MAFYDFNKVLELSKTVVYKYYPNAVCAILTGSQTEEDFVSVVSDIDILIIDFELSGVSSEGMIYEGIKIDFSRVGIWNLVDVLTDSCYSKNNTIMNMIVIGHFINDSLNLEASLREYCQILYRSSNVNYFSEYQNIRRSLIMLRKNFSKELRDEEIPLTLSDFMLKISKAYLFFHYDGKYGLNGYRRSKLLHRTEKDLNFLKHINKLAKKYFINKDGKDIIFQIERFLGHSLLNTKNIQDFRYVLNIDFARQNSFIFFTEIVSKIKGNPFLNNFFLYGNRVVTNSIFPYEYVLVFESKNSVLDASVLERFNVLFEGIGIKGLKYKYIDAFYIKQSWLNVQNYLSYEPIFSVINEVVICVIANDLKYNYKKMAPIFLYIVLRCKLSWGISSNSIKEALVILRDKFKPSVYFQETNYEKVTSNNIIIKDLDDVFLKNNVDIIESFKEYILKNTFFDEAKQGFPVFEKLDKCISMVKITDLDSSSLPMFVQKIFDNQNLGNSYNIVTFFDFALKSMGLNINQYAPIILISLSAIQNED